MVIQAAFSDGEYNEEGFKNDVWKIKTQYGFVSQYYDNIYYKKIYI